MNSASPHVYDKAKYHLESVEQAGLPESHASNHTVPILRWLIDNGLMSEFFVTESGDDLGRYKRGALTIHGLYESWDTCLISDMLSDEGNAFAMHYFDFERGKYLQDYIATLQGDLPTEFHVEYSEVTYAKLRSIIDRRYQEWKRKQKKAWWEIWK
jgi:hypothetical protein